MGGRILVTPRSLTAEPHPEVIATTHIGGFTAESVDRATAIAAANLLDPLALAGAHG